MNNFIRKLLFKNGIQIRNSGLINLRNESVHPLEAIYRTGTSTVSLLMNIPVSKCRTQLWNTLEKSKNPFVITIEEYNDSKAKEYNTSAIKSYYKYYAPQNAAEVLKLNTNEVLQQISAYGYILPWDNRSVADMIKIRERDARGENRKEGKELGLSAGHTDFGPVDDEKGEIEFKRLVKVFANLQKQGYIEKPYLNDGAIKGYFLIGENEDWCFIVKSGKHRAYALSALGYTSIPVMVDTSLGVLKRISELRFYPQVKQGVFSEKEAALLFNRILDVANQG